MITRLRTTDSRAEKFLSRTEMIHPSAPGMHDTLDGKKHNEFDRRENHTHASTELTMLGRLEM